jgi:hypothetical protein
MVWICLCWSLCLNNFMLPSSFLLCIYCWDRSLPWLTYHTVGLYIHQIDVVFGWFKGVSSGPTHFRHKMCSFWSRTPTPSQRARATWATRPSWWHMHSASRQLASWGCPIWQDRWHHTSPTNSCLFLRWGWGKAVYGRLPGSGNGELGMAHAIVLLKKDQQEANINVDTIGEAVGSEGALRRPQCHPLARARRSQSGWH